VRNHDFKSIIVLILKIYQRYFVIKQMKLAERKNLNPRAVFFAGKAAPACRSTAPINDKADVVDYIAKFVVNVARVINADPDTKDYLQLYFLPDYSVSLAEVLILASDISQHISTAGTETSGTLNMKFCLNGRLLGTVGMCCVMSVLGTGS